MPPVDPFARLSLTDPFARLERRIWGQAPRAARFSQPLPSEEEEQSLIANIGSKMFAPLAAVGKIGRAHV